MTSLPGPTEPLARTKTTLALELNVPESAIDLVLALCPDIRPVLWADTVPVFDSDVLARVRHEVNKILARHDKSEVAQ